MPPRESPLLRIGSRRQHRQAPETRRTRQYRDGGASAWPPPPDAPARPARASVAPWRRSWSLRPGTALECRPERTFLFVHPPTTTHRTRRWVFLPTVVGKLTLREQRQ